VNSIFTTSTSATCQRRFADVPAGSDVADFRCPMCTSAEHYLWGTRMKSHMIYQTLAITLSNLWTSFQVLKIST